jgi:hypothetical protein
LVHSFEELFSGDQSALFCIFKTLKNLGNQIYPVLDVLNGAAFR